MTTLTCEHCESEIDVAKDPNCVVYGPSGSTEVNCESCRDFIYEQWKMRGREAYRIKRGWRA